jgi:lipoyl(octanoyl) transferase
VAPILERHLRTYLAWEPYDATPDYEPRPEPKHNPAHTPGHAPGHTPRIELLTPAK